jgi:hypothetical protein
MGIVLSNAFQLHPDERADTLACIECDIHFAIKEFSLG